eukprot:762605-Hanusia_phi.AAC.2
MGDKKASYGFPTRLDPQLRSLACGGCKDPATNHFRNSCVRCRIANVEQQNNILIIENEPRRGCSTACFCMKLLSNPTVYA